MTTVVQRREVRIHFPRGGERKILEIGGIGRRQQELTVRLEKSTCCFEQVRRAVEMFDHIARNHEIEIAETFEIASDPRLDEFSSGISVARELDAACRSVDASNLVTKRCETSADVTVATTEIADRLHAVEALHELDEHTRRSEER